METEACRGEAILPKIIQLISGRTKIHTLKLPTLSHGHTISQGTVIETEWDWRPEA